MPSVATARRRATSAPWIDQAEQVMQRPAADGYRTAWLQAEQCGGGRDHVRLLIDELRRCHLIRDCKVLELGSGLGANLRLLADGNQVQGVESLHEAAALACAAGVPTLVADLERARLPWEDGSWDWILMLDVLEHFVSPELVLGEARRLLAPGGRIVVNVPNAFDWRSRWRLLRGAGVDSTRHFPDAPAWRYPHLRFFRHHDLIGLLSCTGFVVESDLSGRQPSLPKARWWPQLAGRVATRWPELAASGFFVVARQGSMAPLGPK
jgi:SAM-dependent methyltransferase